MEVPEPDGLDGDENAVYPKQGMSGDQPLQGRLLTRGPSLRTAVVVVSVRLWSIKETVAEVQRPNDKESLVTRLQHYLQRSVYALMLINGWEWPLRQLLTC